MRPRISIRGCVRPSIRRCVGRLVRNAFVKIAEDGVMQDGDASYVVHGWSIWPPGQRSMTVAATYTMRFQLPHMINIQKKVNLFWSAF